MIDELNKVKDQDLRIKCLLNRKEQNSVLLRDVNGCIEQATILLEKVEKNPLDCYNTLGNIGERMRDNSSGHYRSRSPTYN